MRARVFVLAALIGSTLAVVARNAVHAATKLTTGPRQELPFGSFDYIVGTSKCDMAGNVYARPVHLGAPADANFLAPIKKVAPEGRTTGSFRLANAWEGWQDSAARGIFVDGNGTLYQAAGGPGGVWAGGRGGAYVVTFAQDGSVKSKTKLETKTWVDPLHVAVFESGRLLISGDSGEHTRTPYTAVFEASGKLLKEIYEPEDEDARSKAVLGDTEFTNNSERGNSFVWDADVTLGSDGNAYLLHGTAPLVYAISPTGQVIRKMQIGVGGSELAFRSIKPYHGQLAIGLARFGHIEVHVTNLKGVPTDSYGMDTEGDVLELACYDSRGLTFISAASHGGAYLLNAKP